jgi:hypothetical protein
MKTRMLHLFAALCLFAPAAFADSAADIRRRMADRLPKLDELRVREVVGENNRGFAELRGNAAEADELVRAENIDREKVYALIAQQTGATAEQVGRHRAEDIAQQARPGVWLQDKTGKWYRK